MGSSCTLPKAAIARTLEGLLARLHASMVGRILNATALVGIGLTVATGTHAANAQCGYGPAAGEPFPPLDLAGRYVGRIDGIFCETLRPPPSILDIELTGDALFALRGAVGALACEPCRCDADGSGNVRTSDALAILKFAVGLDVILKCPPC